MSEIIFFFLYELEFSFAIPLFLIKIILSAIFKISFFFLKKKKILNACIPFCIEDPIYPSVIFRKKCST